eukprot:TRINITY_DN4991_c0_g1_i6.p1 TRINITY_DN4991_c0_g1~~TRINITY_DN4991_c0_g1_i6.p1  ORF type:complete len:294 (+),score=87.52 TRINITY_DN4991_c0_g1_i6:75-956(+)
MCIRDRYYANADVAVIVFDLSKKQSEDEASEYLIELAKRRSIPKVVVVIANKADFVDKIDKRVNDAQLRWKDKATFFSTASAKTGLNINEIFDKIAVILYKEKCYENLKLKKCVKALVLGDKGTGKTSVIERFSLGVFAGGKTKLNERVISEARCSAKEHKLQLLDVETEEEFQKYKNNADAFVIVYDLTLGDPLFRVKWFVSKVRKAADAKVPVLLIGNKLDLVAGPAFKNSQLMAFTKSEKLLHKFTSAKNGFGFASLFEDLIREVTINRGVSDIDTKTQKTPADPSCTVF